jgi:hypothetical protein
LEASGGTETFEENVDIPPEHDDFDLPHGQNAHA